MEESQQCFTQPFAQWGAALHCGERSGFADGDLCMPCAEPGRVAMGGAVISAEPGAVRNWDAVSQTGTMPEREMSS